MSTRAAAASPAWISIAAPPPPGQRARRRDPPARDEEGAQEAGLARRGEQTDAQRAQAGHLADRGDDLLEGCDAVTQAGGILVALVAGQPPQALAQRRQRIGRVGSFESVERARRTAGELAALQRPVRRRLGAGHPGRAAPAQVDVAVGPRATSIRRRTQLTKHAQLLQCRLDLVAERAPLDAGQRTECRLHGRPLALAAEIRAQARPQVSRTPDIERLVVPVPEDVDAGRRRRGCDERPLGMEATRPRSGELDEVGDRARAALLRESDQREQDLGSRLRIRERPVTRPHARAEELRERCEPDACGAAGEQAPGEPHGVDDRSRDAAPREPFDGPVEKRHVEARIVGDQHRIAGELEKAPHRQVDARRPPDVRGADAGERRDRRRQRKAGIDQRLERRPGLERGDPLCADLDDPARRRREPRRLEVEHDEHRLLERNLLGRRHAQTDGGTAPGETRIAGDDLVEQRACDPRRRRGEREERTCGLVHGHRAASRLDELHEPVRGIEAELHLRHRRRTCVRVRRGKKGARRPLSIPVEEAKAR